MSGSTETERQATSDEELAREFDRRLDEQENPTSIRAGSWVISTEPATESLVAHHDNGSGVKLADKPPEGTDPDALTEPPPPAQIPLHKTPRIRKTGAIFSNSHNANQVYTAWNTVAFEEPAGAWVHDGSTITIPEDGDYMVTVVMPFANRNVGGRMLALQLGGNDIDRDTRNAERPNPALPAPDGGTGELTPRIAGVWRFTRDNQLRCVVWQFSDNTALFCGNASFGAAAAQWTITKIADADYPEHPADGSPYIATAPVSAPTE